MDNSKKIILDLCGGTGSWSRPYKEAGYDVRVITLPEWDVTKVFFHQDSMQIFSPKNSYTSWFIPFNKIYGILAAPPCTEFSVAKADNPRDLRGGMEVVRSCLEIIWQVRMRNKIQFWSLENPRGLLRQFLGKPVFTFEHWQFGDLGIKPTDIWGYFNSPKIIVKERPAGLVKQYPNGKTNSVVWGTPEIPEEYKNLKLSRADLRAITPAGFAKAFYKANQ